MTQALPRLYVVAPESVCCTSCRSVTLSSMVRVFSIFLISSTFLFCLWFTFTSSTANLLGNETDVLALLSFKSQITLDPSQVFNSWNESSHFCQWEGVSCGHKHQRVTELDLRSRGLVGSISPHLGNMSFLRGLVLMNNSFQGDIPANIDQLSRLEYLILYNNSLVGEIPVNLSFCSNLNYIYLYNNKLHGNIPRELGSLHKLNSLDFSGNQLTGGIPPSFGNLTTLQNLFLGFNNLNGNIPTALDKLKTLQTLSLGVNKLLGMVPPSLYNLSNLKVFDIGVNHLSGNLPIDIGLTLPAVKSFFIGGNQFFGPIHASLFNASKLEHIDMSENNFTGKVPLAVGNLKNLKSLRLGMNSLGSGKSGDLDFVTSLTNCTNLYFLSSPINHFGGTLPSSLGNLSTHVSVLHFGRNMMHGNIPTEIANLQELLMLKLSNNFFTGSIPISFQTLKNLQKLYLANNQLSGNLPSTRNMSRLYLLELQNNFLKGTISPALENQILEIVDLSDNKFSGLVPREIGQSSRLLLVDFSRNQLNDSIPLEVGNLKNLYYLAISLNNMSGEIPKTLPSCSNLQSLYLDGNSFSGPLLFSRVSWVDLNYMNLSDNKLSGSIPKELEKLSALVYLNMSFNLFEGEVPKEGIFQNASGFSIFGNPKVCGGTSKLHLPKCHIPSSNKRKTRLSLKVTLGVLLPLFVMLMVLVFLRVRRARCKALPDHSGLDHNRVSFIDLHRATNGFSSINLIGKGRYGFVYKGMHQQVEPIAVKVFNLRESRAMKTFLAECGALRVIRHRNLLKILTVCSSVDFNGDDFKALVFNFMKNGSLDSWLHPDSEIENEPRYLTFHQRLNIAIDIASALDYIHNHCEDPVIHCDLKPSNVLLGDDLTAHVGNFGFAKILSPTSTPRATDSSSVSIKGTIGYIPPEYGGEAGNVSTQGDLYSYGILLLEMFTGKRPTDPSFKDGLTLHEYSQVALPHRVMEIIDIHMLSEFHDESASVTDQLEECLISIVGIGIACSVDLSTKRMSIETALKGLISIKRNCS